MLLEFVTVFGKSDFEFAVPVPTADLLQPDVFFLKLLQSLQTVARDQILQFHERLDATLLESCHFFELTIQQVVFANLNDSVWFFAEFCFKNFDLGHTG